MTSKQKLSDIRYLINEFYSTDEDREALTEDAKMSRKCYNDYCEEIKKDLEILEILKKYLKNKSLDLGIEDIIICCENEEDYNKIKEWLENDK